MHHSFGIGCRRLVVGSLLAESSREDNGVARCVMVILIGILIYARRRMPGSILVWQIAKGALVLVALLCFLLRGNNRCHLRIVHPLHKQSGSLLGT